MASYLLDVRNSSSRFRPFADARIQESAAIIGRYGRTSAEAFRKADNHSASCLFEDLSRLARRAFPELSFPIAPSQRIPPARTGRGRQGVVRGTGHTARVAPLRAIASVRWRFPPPNAESMVNFARKELAESTGLVRPLILFPTRSFQTARGCLARLTMLPRSQSGRAIPGRDRTSSPMT